MYQWRVDSKLSAAGRAHRGDGQHNTLPAFPGQSLFPGSAAPWVLFAFPSPAAPQDCSVITACQLVKDSRCLSRRFSLTWHDISPHKALLYHYKVILKENGLVFSIILYCVWWTFSVGNVHDVLTRFRQLLIKVLCRSQIHIHSQKIKIHGLQKSFKASFWWNCVRKCYICPHITKNTLVVKGIKFGSLLGESSLYSLFKHLWKNPTSGQFQDLTEIMFESFPFCICHTMVSS